MWGSSVNLHGWCSERKSRIQIQPYDPLRFTYEVAPHLRTLIISVLKMGKLPKIQKRELQLRSLSLETQERPWLPTKIRMRKEPTSNLLTEYFYTHSFLLFFLGEWCHGSRRECMLNLNATEECPWASRCLCIILLDLSCIACKPFPYFSYLNTLFWILNLLRNCKSFFFFQSRLLYLFLHNFIA